ncbi:hypothetical protein BFL43_22210 [Williamsia sp. 1135]|nr:hypothetical protein BFL43_22210 [Williamsia sp. 1135]
MLAEMRSEGYGVTSGLVVPISQLAEYAHASQASDPRIKVLTTLTRDELAVLASVIEMEPAGAGNSPAEPALIYAATAFGADRSRTLDALSRLGTLNLITLRDRTSQVDIVGQEGHELTDPEALPDLGDADDAECRVIAQGLIQITFGRSAVPRIADLVVNEFLEGTRLESYVVHSHTGVSDPLDLLAMADAYPASKIARRLRGRPDPLLAIWMTLGDQKFSVVAAFNNAADRDKGKKAADAAHGVNWYGRRVSIQRTFVDPSRKVPSNRFFSAVYYATGLPTFRDRDTGKWWMESDENLSIEEYAQRQVDLINILRESTSELERNVYALNEDRGFAVGKQDRELQIIELRGTRRVTQLEPEQVEIVSNPAPFQWVRLEQSLKLPPDQRTRSVLQQRRMSEQLGDDPVIAALNHMWESSREFNSRQPQTRIKLSPSVVRVIRDAHVRDMKLARTLSESLTIAGQRGHRDQVSLRVAFLSLGPKERRHLLPAVYATPVGDPSDVQIRFVTKPVQTPEALYASAFGDGSNLKLSDDTAQGMIEHLLGYERGEIEVRAV